MKGLLEPIPAHERCAGTGWVFICVGLSVICDCRMRAEEPA